MFSKYSWSLFSMWRRCEQERLGPSFVVYVLGMEGQILKITSKGINKQNRIISDSDWAVREVLPKEVIFEMKPQMIRRTNRKKTEEQVGSCWVGSDYDVSGEHREGKWMEDGGQVGEGQGRLVWHEVAEVARADPEGLWGPSTVAWISF